MRVRVVVAASLHRGIAASHRLEAERVVEFNGRLIVGLNVQVNLNDIIRVLLDLREEWSLRSRLGKRRLLSFRRPFRRPFRRLVVTGERAHSRGVVRGVYTV